MQKILHLATLDKNDNPHIVPVWYLFDLKKMAKLHRNAVQPKATMLQKLKYFHIEVKKTKLDHIK